MGEKMLGPAAGGGRTEEHAPVSLLADELGWSWLELGRRMWSRKASARLHPKLASLSPGRLQALMLLGETAEPRICDLAEALALDESTVTRLVDRLEQDGLARRQSSTSDRRATVVGLTPEGRAALAEMQEQRRRLFTEILAALDPTERAELVRLTAKVVDAWRARAEVGR
jgi:DNA-binding MarR family transcriptional regulator